MMLRRLLLAALLLFAPIEAQAQFAVIAPTVSSATDNSDRIATTAWINNFVNAGLPLAAGKIWIGSAGGIATPQTPSGDWTISNVGVATLATVNANVGSFGSATQCVAFTTTAKGLITAASAVTCTPAIGSVTGLGTGIAAALGINVGTAGAPVINGGALGTPSGGTATNLTGLPTTALTGPLQAAQEPAHTGDMTNTAGSLATTVVAINGVNQTTAWTSYTASPSCGTATFTVNTAKSKNIGKTIFWQWDITITAIGTCTNALSVAAPATAQSGGSAGARETAISGLNFNCDIAASTAAFSCSPPSGSFAVNDRLVASGVYESQ